MPERHPAAACTRRDCHAHPEPVPREPLEPPPPPPPERPTDPWVALHEERA